MKAHRISPALLALDDSGGVGVRIVDARHVVQMVPVNVIKDDAQGVWVTGLPETATVITVGQELVGAGDRVDVAYETDGNESLNAASEAADTTALAGTDTP